jgi:hypothetical protein
MNRSPFARLGLAVLASALIVTGLAAPAQAAAPGTVSGRLTTTAGEVVADARVVVYDHPDYNYVGETTTGADGRYEVQSVPVGKVKVSFDAGHEQWANGKLDFETATVFTVTSGGTTTVDEKLLPTGTITGKFTVPNSDQLPSTQVTAEEVTSGRMSYGTLDDEGRYAIDALPGQYTVEFRLENARQYAPQARTAEDAAKFTVVAGESVTVDDTLLPVGSLGGKLVDAKGTAVAKADVVLHENGQSLGNTSTDSKGAYLFQNVLTGSYKVSFDPPKGAEQWAKGKTSEDAATSFTVTADKLTTVNDKLLATGTVTGRFSKRDGKAFAGVRVEVTPLHGDGEFNTKTDSKGKYRMANVTVGTYTVSFTDKTGRVQYAYGKGEVSKATRFTVKAGKTTTVNDKQVAAATLKITAKDAKTGKKLKNFCVFVANAPKDYYCTKGNEIVVKNLSAKTHSVSVSPAEGSLYLSADIRTTVKAGQTKSVAVPLQLGGAIRATITNRATGKPVKRACIVPIRPSSGGVGDGGGDCTDSKGKVQSHAQRPGTYSLFVETPEPYGVQWVGKSAGTGDQRAAAKITVKPGKVVSAPAVKLDKAGTVTGTVTADGTPVEWGNVSYSAWDFGVGPSHGADIDKKGGYTLEGLGPYAWPLVFTTTVGRQWSGNVGNRFTAKTVTVKAGATVTHNEAVVKGVEIKGKVNGKGWVRLTAYDAVTGDPMGVDDLEKAGPYSLTVPGSGTVKLRYLVDRGSTWLDGWHNGAKDFARATVITIPATGSTTVNVKIP